MSSTSPRTVEFVVTPTSEGMVYIQLGTESILVPPQAAIERIAVSIVKAAAGAMVTGAMPDQIIVPFTQPEE